MGDRIKTMNRSAVLENRSVLELYKEVVDDVINNVRQLFIDDGAEERLEQLQELWETKLIQSGAIGGTQPDNFSGPVSTTYSTDTFQAQTWTNPTTSTSAGDTFTDHFATPLQPNTDYLNAPVD